MAISIKPTEDTVPGISIMSTELTQSFSDDLIAEKSSNYDLAMGVESLGADFYRQAIKERKDPVLREQGAYTDRIKLREERLQWVQEYLAQRDSTQPLTADDVEFINGITDEDYIQNQTDPATFFERKLAKQAISKVDFSELAAQNTSMADLLQQSGEDVIAHQQAARTLSLELRDQYADRTGVQKTFDTLSTFLPYYFTTSIGNFLEDIPDTGEGGFLPGSTFKEKFDWFYQTPLTTALPLLKKELARIGELNPVVAMEIIDRLVGYSTTDQLLDNVIGVGDIGLAVPGPTGLVSVKGAAALAKGGASAAQQAANTSVKHAVRSAARRKLKPFAGNVQDESLVTALEEIRVRAAVVGQVEDMDGLLGRTQTISNPGSLGDDVGSLGTERAMRLSRELESTAGHLMTAATDNITVARIAQDSQAMDAGLDIARQNLLVEYPALTDYVMDVVPINAADTPNNVSAVAFRIGNREALPFPTQSAATNVARNILGLKNFTVENFGTKQYVIQTTKNISETDQAVRNLLVPTDNPTPVSLKNMVLGLLRTPDDLLPKDIAAAMKVATYGSSALLNIVQEAAKFIGKLPSKQKQRLNDFLEYQKNYIDPKGNRGWNSNTFGQFERDWHVRFNEIPSEDVAKAYFNFRQIHDFDYFVRNLGIHRDRAIAGIQENYIRFKAKVPKISKRGLLEKSIETPTIQGKVRQAIDWNIDEDTGIAILDQTTGNLKTFRKNTLRAAEREDIEQYLKDGFTLIEMTPWGWDALRSTQGITGVPNHRVTYLLAEEVSTKPLRYEQIPYKMGSHVEYVPGYYLSQADLETLTRNGKESTLYKGDVNIFHFDTEAKAKFWETKMEQARALYNAGNEQATRAFVEGQTPFTWADFVKLWKTADNPNGLLNPARPIQRRATGVNLATAHNLQQQHPNFFSMKDSAYNLERGVNLEYATERDLPLNTVATEGSAANPIYKLTPAKTIDPLSLIDRNTHRLLQSRYLDDLKVKATERYVSEFGSLFDATPQELWANPMQTLMRDDFIKTAPREKIAAAKNYRRSVLGFLGMKNDVQRNIDTLKQKLANQIYERLGQKAFDLAAPHLIYTTKDPLKRMRQFAFTTKLGLFNPVQMFLQMQTMTHVTALEGAVNTSKAMAAATLFSYLKYGTDAAALNQAAKVAVKMGWKNPEEFKEAFNAYRQSGMFIVGPEHGFQDALLDARLFKGKFGNFFDKSAFFFNTGERGVRNVAFAAAYLRWRGANPGKVFDNAAKTQVLARADLLTVNMSRASLASWQRGWASAATQFFGYQARLMEQLIGGRLTHAERARALLMYSAVYGIPIASGATIGGVWDLGEDIRMYLQKNNIDYDESMLEAFMDGAVSMGMEFMTGTKYNFPERYGPGGNPMLREILNGDKEILDLFFGVSGSILGDVAIDPFLRIMFSGVTDSLGEAYPITYDDFLRAARNISSVDQGYNFMMALTAGKFFTKNGEPVGDVTNFDGFMRLLGLQPQAFPDMYREGKISKKKRERLEGLRRYAIEKLRAGWSADDLDSRDAFDKQAQIYIRAFEDNGATPDQVHGLISEALKGYETKFEETYTRMMRADPKRYERAIKQLQKRNKEIDGRIQSTVP